MKPLFIYLVFFYLCIFQIAPRFFALTTKYEDATVILKGCESRQCHLKGIYGTDPITLDKYILKADGTKVVFKHEDVCMSSWPTQEN